MRQHSYQILSLFLIKRIFSQDLKITIILKIKTLVTRVFQSLSLPQVPVFTTRLFQFRSRTFERFFWNRFLVAVIAKEKVIFSVNVLNSNEKMTLTNIDHLPVLQLELIKEPQFHFVLTILKFRVRSPIQVIP